MELQLIGLYGPMHRSGNSLKDYEPNKMRRPDKEPLANNIIALITSNLNHLCLSPFNLFSDSLKLGEARSPK